MCIFWKDARTFDACSTLMHTKNLSGARLWIVLFHETKHIQYGECRYNLRRCAGERILVKERREKQLGYTIRNILFRARRSTLVGLCLLFKEQHKEWKKMLALLVIKWREHWMIEFVVSDLGLTIIFTLIAASNSTKEKLDLHSFNHVHINN